MDLVTIKINNYNNVMNRSEQLPQKEYYLTIQIQGHDNTGRSIKMYCKQ